MTSTQNTQGGSRVGEFLFIGLCFFVGAAVVNGFNTWLTKNDHEREKRIIRTCGSDQACYETIVKYEAGVTLTETDPPIMKK